MNWNLMQGNWAHIAARAQERWGRLIDDDVRPVPNQREWLLERIQMRYGVLQDEAERQILNWERRVTEAWFRRPVASAQRVADVDGSVLAGCRVQESPECHIR
ncbi:general stress protein CsbD [Aquabacterium sp. A08]|uniref:general stress protein CsbD n=1 Tax=Aquabacterium sp. A08 TaxID=2718532 RepID=UPI001AAF4CB7|nr:general stress protein CsbD [Aquabacterium sp. A08]